MFESAVIACDGMIKRDAFCDVLGQPPTRIAGLIGGAIDRGVQPIAVELKKLT